MGLFAALMLIATFISTLLFNVPLNNLLDATNIHSVVVNGTWLHCLDKWVKWNHVRVWLSFLATVLYMTELLRVSL